MLSVELLTLTVNPPVHDTIPTTPFCNGFGIHRNPPSYAPAPSQHQGPRASAYTVSRTLADPIYKTTGMTVEEMSAARLPLAYRDSCAALLDPLNRCRKETGYLPWKCEVS